jgi:hypothetical protein
VELKIEIGFNELLSAIKQLSENQLAILKEEISKKEQPPMKNKDFKEFLLKGPIMTDEHYKTLKETRKKINQWRSK